MALTPPDRPSDRSLYAVLNVPEDASEEDVKRAYRQLVTTYHPDKARDPELQEEASRAFTRIQDAYEVLSDPARRDVYDIYGAEGLAAGMELGDPLKSKDDFRREFEAFRERQRRDKLEASVNYRGLYVFRVNATALVTPYNPALPRTPELSNIYMTSGVDVPIDASKDWGVLGSEQDVLHLGGLVNVRGEVGGGSFLAGYKRLYSDYSTLELHAAAGLKSLLSLQSGIQLSPAATGSLIATWQPKGGVGLQFVTSRQLTETVSGEFSWVVGPRESRGMSVGITRRTEKTSISGRVEVGAATALALRFVRQVGESATARLGFKFGTTGVELDVGGNRRLSEVSTAGLSVVAGLQGAMLRLRYSRAGHTFEFPILLSTSLDLKVLASAYLGPPLAIYIAQQWVLAPLGRSIEGRRSRAERRRKAEQITAALAEAASAAKLMGHVARRRVGKEAAANGLVVVLALYGEESAVKAAARERLLAAAAHEPPAAQAAVAAAEAAPAMSTGRDGEVRAHPLADVAAAAGHESPLQQAPSQPTGDTASSSTCAVPPPSPPVEDSELPPALADVTVAVQYLCKGGRVVLHQGFAKSALLGFCDPAPGAPKLLLVYFTFKGRPFVARLADAEGAQLPGRGALVTDTEEAAAVVAAAKKLT